jgi:pimeloyl-ACP methyl ester carboxylesterase
MKITILTNVLKTTGLVILLSLSIASCKKDDNNSSPVKDPVDYHKTAATKFATVGDVKFAYRVLGDQPGTPLILISALASSMDDWDPAVTNGLAANNKVIIFDIQGVASSTGTTPNNIPDMAKGVVAFIKALGYTKVNLMGFSMGSFISQQIVLTEPGLVNKIILTGTGPKGAAGLSNLPNLLGAAAGLSPEDSFLKFAFTSATASVAAGKAVWLRTLERTVDRDVPLSAATGGAELTAVLGWAQPTQPVLIAQGEEDLAIPVINSQNMSKGFPNAKLIIYPDAGHAAFFQYHDQFVASVNDFLKN